MPGGTSKAVLRRLGDSRFSTVYFRGEGIDIGAGGDPLFLYSEQFPLIRKLRVWDQGDGDAQTLTGLADESFDFVHSSHCLEHLVDPAEGLRNWFRVLKPGGHMVLLLPDEDLYEQGVFPSTFNADHKWTFTISKAESWSRRSINVTDILGGLGGAAEILKIELLDAGHRFRLPRFDQTLTPTAECGIEIVLRKRMPDELIKKGRLPPDGRLSPDDIFVLTGLR
ncbi:SAM-dependent methyltransferase [Paramagnetospirillum kuznetsovii]|uniref:SAM-dependent methyltransferase n=1 Tax=Paramagnetospirillum kuznetsovii TaxID=2053833 RepID=A0A364NWV9_9PROT|nr:class I SAM-dependent methyltransferase [Paramagnetospirillum kuznetsovii]RAU21581.1 SAM-dependent methyltransferase [Paramagnetospirillum kuznetsovii]